MTTMSRTILAALQQWKEAITPRFVRMPAFSLGGPSELPGVVPTYTSGTGAPTHSAPPASGYFQRDGTAVTTLWIMVDTTWTAIGAVGGAGVFTDLTATGNTILGNATTDTITPTGRLAADLLPSTNAARSLGSTALRYLDGWFTGTLYNTLQDWTAATGVAKAIVGANLAIAWRLADSVGDFLTVQSTTAARFLKFARPWMDAAPTSVNMAGAAHALVWGTAGAAQTSVTSRIITVTAGAGVPTLTLPDVTVGDGVELTILNASSTTFLVAGAATHRVYQNGSVVLISAAGFWLLKDIQGTLKAGTITVSLGASSGTATIQGGAATDWDGKPVTVQTKTSDATFLQPVSAEISGGVLTVTGAANATGAVDVYYQVNGA